MRTERCILFLLPRFSGGGAERVILNLLTGLHSLDYSVAIVVFNKSGPLLSMVPNGVPIYNLKTGVLKSSIVPLIKKIRQLKPIIVLSTLGYINVALLGVRWLLPRSTKIWIREANMPSISLPNNSNPKLMAALYWLMYRGADKLICTSEKMEKEFISRFLVNKDILEILHNPVDVDTIRSSIKSVKRFDKGGVCYVAAGRLTFQKGFDRLLCWFSKIENKKSTLVILGEGILKDKLKKQSKILGLQKNINFIGFCNNPWQWYAGADIFLLPSRWEGMPNSVFEALVCGTPVIATEESGGIKEVIGYSESDSITITTNTKEFIHAMNKSKIKNQNIRSDSLLPERYNIDNVVSTVERWLSEIE